MPYVHGALFSLLYGISPTVQIIFSGVFPLIDDQVFEKEWGRMFKEE